MKRFLIAGVSFGLSICAGPALADMYWLPEHVGMSGTVVFDDAAPSGVGYSLYGDYTIGVYSPSHQMFAQNDFSIDIFNTDTRSANWSLIVARDLDSYKVGGFLGAYVNQSGQLLFSAGATGMAQVSSNIVVQGEIGTLTSGLDNGIFIDNSYFGHVRADYEYSDTLGFYAKYTRIQDESDYLESAIVGVTYNPSQSYWLVSAGAGAFHDDTGTYPMLNTEVKYMFGKTDGQQMPGQLTDTYFDKFNILDFYIQ